ncbi:MAG: hypothetical protein OXU20_35330 [Myxococcales bacterium]|nr:hypothetical protein [Myxococcales bacterium]
MRKQLLIACMLALCGTVIGCAAATTPPDPATAEPDAPSGDGPPPTPDLGQYRATEPTMAQAGTGAGPDLQSEERGAADQRPRGAEEQPTAPTAEEQETSAAAEESPDDHPRDAQETADPTEVERATTMAAVEENLARLRSLNLFEVGGLVATVPGEAYSCAYNQPCPGDEADTARAVQSARLAELVVAGEEVQSMTGLDTPDRTPQEHLQALQRLSIVRIGALVIDEPATSGFCYNLPCPEDKAEAEAKNARRAAELSELVHLTEDL